MKSTRFSRWAAGLALPFLSAYLGAGEQPWQALASLPEPNGGCVGGAVPGAILVVGGTNWSDGQKHWLSTVHRLDLETLRWTTLTPLAQPLAYAVGGVGPDRLTIAGGTTGQAMFTGSIRLSGAAVATPIGPGITVPAVLAAGAQLGDELIVVGGSDDAANAAGFRRDAFAWNVRTGEQRTLAPYPGPALGVAAATNAGDELFVFGGAGWNSSTKAIFNLTDAYAFSATTNTWRRLQPLPYAVRGLAAVTLDAGHLYLAGGYKNDAEGFIDQAFIYDIAQDRYTPAPSLPYRACVSLVASGDYVYCLGGEDLQKHRSAAVYRVKIAALKR